MTSVSRRLPRAWQFGIGSATVLVIIGIVVAALVTQPTQSPDDQPSSPVVAQESEPSSYDLLASLEIKGRAPMTGYDRDEFGQAWSDDVRVEGGRNGCDTRNDILRRDLDDVVIRDGTHGCLVEEGTLVDPYSGETIYFQRGDGQVEIDHVVSLANAWVTGAQYWNEDLRRDFANDPLNLLAVETSLNRQKGAGDAATWLPPNKAIRCDFARRQIAVKAEYQLWVTQAEHDILHRELGRCQSA